MKNNRILTAVLTALFLCFTLTAQDMRSLIQERPELSAGYYRSYDVPAVTDPAAARPEGYTPFYISHYGRHGSRWHSSASKYEGVLHVLDQAASASALTPAGEQLRVKVRALADGAVGRYGDLSPRGTREHRGIAERMFRTYPEVFASRNGQPAQVDSRSTTVIRCILSMAAFDERLKELCPELLVTRESSVRNMAYIGNHEQSNAHDVFHRAGIVSDSLRTRWIDSRRFIRSIFSDKSFIKEHIERPEVWMYDAFVLCGIAQDVDRPDLAYWENFTDDELYTLWSCINVYAYMTMGPSLRFGDLNMEDARPLLRNIVQSADEVISGQSDVAAHLRFGHDSNIIPLLSLMGLSNVAVRVPLDQVARNWNLSMVSPMATNLQMIFFRNPEGQVKVRVLHNEKDASLPLPGAPFYDWKVLRDYLENRL